MKCSNDEGQCQDRQIVVGEYAFDFIDLFIREAVHTRGFECSFEVHPQAHTPDGDRRVNQFQLHVLVGRVHGLQSKHAVAEHRHLTFKLTW